MVDLYFVFIINEGTCFQLVINFEKSFKFCDVSFLDGERLYFHLSNIQDAQFQTRGQKKVKNLFSVLDHL